MKNEPTYVKKLRIAVQQSGSCLCVGLDPDLKRIPAAIKKRYSQPEAQVVTFLTKVIDCTAEYCAAFKPNLGFFEALGDRGLAVFRKVIRHIPEGKIIIADVKRGDISATAAHYAIAYFDTFNVDAVTINPLMGFETLDPFLGDDTKGVYVLTLTSNPGADDFLTCPFHGYPSMAEYIASKLAKRNAGHQSHIGMVVGATHPPRIEPVIQHHPKGSLLIPGIGAQGGSIDDLQTILSQHPSISLINSSRSILYAGENLENWEKATAQQAKKYNQILNPISTKYGKKT